MVGPESHEQTRLTAPVGHRTVACSHAWCSAATWYKAFWGLICVADWWPSSSTRIFMCCGRRGCGIRSFSTSLPHGPSPPPNDQELPQIGVNRISTFCCNSCCFQVLAKITSVCMELELMSRICSEPLGDFPNYSPCWGTQRAPGSPKYGRGESDRLLQQSFRHKFIM